MEIPFFSVLIPVYKNVEYLSLCLNSIIDQSFSDFEIIACYQGETGFYNEVYDDRIVNIYLEKPSLYKARIESYRRANGKYVIFVDSDDELIDGALARLHQVISENDYPDIIQFGYTSNKDSTNVTDLRSPKDILNKEEYMSYFLTGFGTYPIWRKCFKHNQIDFYDEDIFMGEDALLTLAFIKGSSRILSLDDCLYYYRPNEKSGTSNLKAKYLDDLAIFILHSFPYRKTKKEVEMGIYSFLSTFLVIHSTFPTYDFLAFKNVNEVVDVIYSYNFITKPAFIKRQFIKSIKTNKSGILDKFYILLFKLMRYIKYRFAVSVRR